MAIPTKTAAQAQKAARSQGDRWENGAVESGVDGIKKGAIGVQFRSVRLRNHALFAATRPEGREETRDNNGELKKGHPK